MKVNEIIPRQTRIVYILMAVLAAIGLVWAFWERQHRASEVAPPKPTPTAVAAPAQQPPTSASGQK